MLAEMSSKEVTEWQAYFNLKEKKQKQREAEEEAKARAEKRAKGC